MVKDIDQRNVVLVVVLVVGQLADLHLPNQPIGLIRQSNSYGDLHLWPPIQPSLHLNLTIYQVNLG